MTLPMNDAVLRDRYMHELTDEERKVYEERADKIRLRIQKVFAEECFFEHSELSKLRTINEVIHAISNLDRELFGPESCLVIARKFGGRGAKKTEAIWSVTRVGVDHRVLRQLIGDQLVDR